MNPIDKLTSLFSKFPGIGPRQAKRFVYFLLQENDSYTRELLDLITRIRREISYCLVCYRLSFNQSSKICNLCSDPKRDPSILMVVAKDIDLENIARSGSYTGKYFLLGGLLPILEKGPEEKIRIRELLSLVQVMVDTSPALREIIIALSVNPEGDNTVDYIKNYLLEITQSKGIKISVLGRGLSTGTELEYSDSETIKNALTNRH